MAEREINRRDSVSRDEDEAEGGVDSLPEEISDSGLGTSPIREQMQTDGPVMGGPGMMRTAGDRAVSTGTGGLAAGEDLDPVAEGDYWRENFRRRPYYEAEREYSDYEPAYRYGWERAGLSEYRNRGFEEVELDLRRGWESSAGESRPWEEAREPARDAYERARGSRPGAPRADRSKSRRSASSAARLRKSKTDRGSTGP